jgi:hypothetical protein
MITFTRDEAQKLLDTLAEAIDAQQWELDTHISAHGEWFRPKRVEYMKDALANTLRTVELLSHKLNTPQREPITPSGGGGSGEPTVDGWPLYSGLPQPKNEFNPDWDAMAVMVEEQQRMAKCIEELEQREWRGLTYADLYFWGGELGLGELGKGVLRAVDAHLKEKNR